MPKGVYPRTKNRKKSIRISSSLDPETHEKLKELANILGMTKSSLAEECIKECIENSKFAEWIIYKRSFKKKKRKTNIPMI